MPGSRGARLEEQRVVLRVLVHEHEGARPVEGLGDVGEQEVVVGVVARHLMVVDGLQEVVVVKLVRVAREGALQLDASRQANTCDNGHDAAPQCTAAALSSHSGCSKCRKVSCYPGSRCLWQTMHSYWQTQGQPKRYSSESGVTCNGTSGAHQARILGLRAVLHLCRAHVADAVRARQHHRRLDRVVEAAVACSAHLGQSERACPHAFLQLAGCQKGTVLRCSTQVSMRKAAHQSRQIKEPQQGRHAKP